MQDVAPEFLTVKELADLLRLKERKIYDLAASGEVPCSRATGKLLFPSRDIRAWIDGARQGGSALEKDRPAVFLGSHDPLLEWALRHSRCGLATFFVGSIDGLTRLRAGEGIAAGVHVHDAQNRAWNVDIVHKLFANQPMVLVSFATRLRGLVVHPDIKDVQSPSDLAGHRISLRQPESGTAQLFCHILETHGLTKDDVVPAEVTRSEMDAVLAVAQGLADATFGLEPLARQFGLQFVPVIEERFDLLVDRKAWFEPAMQQFLAFCRSKDFTARAKSETGYDVSGLGQVRWNG